MIRVLTIEISIINFWIHLRNLPDTDIAKQYLFLSEELADRNPLSLTLRINILLKRCDRSSINLNNNDTNMRTTHLKLKRKIYEDHQLMLINANRKLDFYSSFKKDTKKIEFLDLLNNPQHKIAINKFRLGNHKLHIETGRYTTPKTPVNPAKNMFFLPFK